jgi:DNA polymerase/3'-5' exonuclease PolX
MKRERVLPVAMEIWRRLSSICVKCVIAGGLRRGKESIGSVEIVCLPDFDRDLFDSPLPTYSRLSALLQKMVEEGVLAWDAEAGRTGGAEEHLLLRALGSLPLTLVIADADGWGFALAASTGNEAFRKAIATPVRYRGLLPNDLKADAGVLWRVRTRFPKLTWERLSCPTEADLFRHVLRLPLLPPEERNERGVAKLRRIAAQGGLKTAA